MSKKEMKEIAKDLLMSSIAVTYYKLEDKNYTQEEEKQICQYINKYGETMGKSINRKYYTM